MTILVAYASRYGATRGIAERIGEVLAARGFEVDVRPADEVTSVTPYDAVVLGSALYSGGWLPDAEELLDSFQEELARRPLWLFSSGPTVTGDPVEVMGGWRYPEALEPLVARTQPRDIALFAGCIDEEKLDLQDWLIARSMRGVTGDFRNWPAIEAWAEGIATVLTDEMKDTTRQAHAPTRRQAPTATGETPPGSSRKSR